MSEDADLFARIIFYVVLASVVVYSLAVIVFIL